MAPQVLGGGLGQPLVGPRLAELGGDEVGLAPSAGDLVRQAPAPRLVAAREHNRGAGLGEQGRGGGADARGGAGAQHGHPVERHDAQDRRWRGRGHGGGAGGGRAGPRDSSFWARFGLI